MSGPKLVEFPKQATAEAPATMALDECLKAIDEGWKPEGLLILGLDSVGEGYEMRGFWAGMNAAERSFALSWAQHKLHMEE